MKALLKSEGEKKTSNGHKEGGNFGKKEKYFIL